MNENKVSKSFNAMANIVKFLLRQLKALQNEFKDNKILFDKIEVILSQTDYMVDRATKQLLED